MKKTLTLMLAAALLPTIATGVCFANEETVAVHITVPTTGLDFSVNEKINMTADSNSGELTIDSLSVKNNNDIGVLNIDSIRVKPANGWALIADTTDFTELPANANKLSLVADGKWDLCKGTLYYKNSSVGPGLTDTTVFTGKTGATTVSKTDIKVAEVEVTVSVKEQNIIRLKVSSRLPYYIPAEYNFPFTVKLASIMHPDEEPVLYSFNATKEELQKGKSVEIFASEKFIGVIKLEISCDTGIDEKTYYGTSTIIQDPTLEENPENNVNIAFDFDRVISDETQF